MSLHCLECCRIAGRGEEFDCQTCTSYARDVRIVTNVRARLEKVRDELKVSRQKDKEVLSHNCYSTVCCENALRMLEAILEGRET